MDHPKASIIVLTYNNLEYTRQCIDSILACTDEKSYELILVDNGSTDGTHEYLRELSKSYTNIQSIFNEKNEGFARGNNLGAAMAGGEYVVFLNNDTIVTPGWLTGLLNQLDDRSVGMVGPVTNSSGNETRINVEYQSILDMPEFAKKIRETRQGKTFEISMLAFLCVALPRAVWEEIGPLDERFGIGMFEDDDYALRLKDKGYKILCVEDVFVHHWGSASFSKHNMSQYWSLFKGNLQKFEAKWGIQWLPPLPRAENIRQQMRQLLDGSLFFFDTIRNQEKALEESQDRISRQDQTIAQAQDTIAHHQHVITTAQNIIAHQQQTIAESQSRIIQQDQTITELRDTKASQENALAELRDTRASQENALAELRNITVSQDNTIAELRSTSTSQQQTIAEFQIAIEKQQHNVLYLNQALNSIYASNGWAFLQYILYIRRFFVPEGSRREKVMRAFIRFLRNFGRKYFKYLGQHIRGLRRPSVRSTVPTQQITASEVSTAAPTHPTLSRSSSKMDPSFPWPLVSVIIPVYNHADMVEEAASSVLYSTYSNVELILLDDGSTDSIEPVLSRLQNNPRVRIFRQPNQKLPRALTHAHKFIQGQFVTWTSADNKMAPQAIERMVQELLDHPEAVLVYADVAVIDDDGQLLQDGSYRPQNVDAPQTGVIRLHQNSQALGFETDNYINACFLYRRAAAEALEGTYASDLAGLEDYDFWLRMQRCGRFHHLQNVEPLYFYRVHKRTMSHDLLTKDLDAHLKRGQQLIEYEASRREYAQKRWEIVLDTSLPTNERMQIQKIAAQLPVDLVEGSSWGADRKRLRFMASSAVVADPIYVRVQSGQWELRWTSPWNGEQKELELWRGVSLSPLALKARQLNRNIYEFPQAGMRPVIGCHLSLANIQPDIELTRQVIRNNPWAFFVFADIPGEDSPDAGQAIVQGLENVVYLGARAFAKSYHLYACFKTLWLPPTQLPIMASEYRTQLALAYSIARPLLLPRGMEVIPAPYQLQYYVPDESIEMVNAFHHEEMDQALLDAYLAQWTPESVLHTLCQYANGISQEMAASRPKFATVTLAETPAKPWKMAVKSPDETLKIALAVNTLDRGGLEEIIGQLARHLREFKVDPLVICFDKGGWIADRLTEQNIPVYCADKQISTVQELLQKEKPDIINSHWANKALLEAASNLGIPLVETIQNTYVWFSDEDWETERQRSRYFTHATAVGNLVKRYYLKRNEILKPEWVSIVPNYIDPARLITTDQTQARQALSLPEDCFLFVTLASYDLRKNHLGTLTAFNQIAKQNPKAHLLCAGNRLDPYYYKKIAAYRDSLSQKDQIHLMDFREDTGTLLSASDCFVINSFFEGWSLAATEALIVGLPLIHSECGSAWELVGSNKERGLVVPNPACTPLNMTYQHVVEVGSVEQQWNTEALVQAMSRMIEDQQLWRGRRESISSESRLLFSLNSSMEKYARLFRELLGFQA